MSGDVKVEPGFFIFIFRSPVRLDRIICDVLGRQDIGPDKLHHIVEVHIVDIVVASMLCALDLGIPFLHTHAKARRGHAVSCEIEIVAAWVVSGYVKAEDRAAN